VTENIQRQNYEQWKHHIVFTSCLDGIHYLLTKYGQIVIIKQITCYHHHLLRHKGSSTI